MSAASKACEQLGGHLSANISAYLRYISKPALKEAVYALTEAVYALKEAVRLLSASIRVKSAQAVQIEIE